MTLILQAAALVFGAAAVWNFLSSLWAHNGKDRIEMAGGCAMLALVSLGAMLWYSPAQLETTPVDPNQEDAAGLAGDECRADLQCWGEKASVEAAMLCPKEVERLIHTEHEWTDGWGSKFSHYRWKDKPVGIITLYGDQLKIRDDQGPWTRVVYECDVVPGDEKVLDVRIKQGRI